jgi:type III pantothenate kinase
VIAGPNPGGIETICRDWEVANCPPPVEISRHGDLPLNISVDSPERVGIDRLLNAVAANVLRPVGQPAIVVSSGTATTVDLITGDGVFAGGAILPGFELAGRSLHEHTALLPQISAAELSGLSVPALGKNTQAAIRAGLLYGQVGAVKELIERLSPDESSVVYLTGGNGALLAPFFVGRATFETELALRALARLAGD